MLESRGSRIRRFLLVLMGGAVLAAAGPGAAHAFVLTDEPVLGAVGATPVDRPFRFAVIGDFGTGLEAQYEVSARMCRWRNGHDFDLVITTGDNIYPDGARRHFQDNFFKPYACLLDNGVSFHATLGNHDVMTRNGRPELNEPGFGIKARNYVLRRGGVRFVMVNSNRIKENWLRRATRPGPEDRWTVVAFHHPVYSPGGEHGSTPGYRPWMPRLFGRRGVDIVFNGHDHLYGVTKPLRKIRYVVTGGGGAALYECSKRWFSARCAERYHFLYVRTGAERLKVRAVPRRGGPFHSFRTRGRD